jgi:hypothetical protein
MASRLADKIGIDMLPELVRSLAGRILTEVSDGV